MADEGRDYHIGLAVGQIGLLGILLDHLEASGAIDTSEIEKELCGLVSSPALQGDSPLQMAQALVFSGLLAWLRKKNAPESKRRWRPVIVGGTAHAKQQSSD